jgi:hypothetical protein
VWDSTGSLPAVSSLPQGSAGGRRRFFENITPNAEWRYPDQGFRGQSLDGDEIEKRLLAPARTAASKRIDVAHLS